VVRVFNLGKSIQGGNLADRKGRHCGQGGSATNG